MLFHYSPLLSIYINIIFMYIERSCLNMKVVTSELLSKFFAKLSDIFAKKSEEGDKNESNK